jgi:hypothetical protein
VKKLTLLLSIFLVLTGCSSGNVAENKLSENRIADIVLLKIEIEDIDSTISHIIKSNERLSSSSPLSQRVISRNQEEISKLESQRDILEKKIMVLYEIEQEYQSNK